MQRISSLVAALACGAFLSAQSTVVIPDDAATAEAPSNTTIPFNRVGSRQSRALYQFDASNFTSQGVTYPITISAIGWRANGGVTSGPATFPSVIVEMSTAATSWQAQSAAYAANHGLDKTQVFNGSVTSTVPAGTTPNSFNAATVLTTSFTYDPLSGNDLCIEVLCDGFLATGTGTAGDLANASNCSRLWDLDFATSGNSANVRPGESSVLELTYVPAPGLYAGFGQDVSTGATPLTVNFNDASVTNDPAGVQTWLWDFDGDGVPDSNQQNPSFVYTAGGVYDVTLTVTDTINGSSTFTKTQAVVAGSVTADFGATDLLNGVLFSFTDRSTGVPNQWAWDFDSDGTIDSTAQNPTYQYATTGPHTVTMTATNTTSGFMDTVTRVGYISDTFCTQFGPGTSFLDVLAGNFVNIDVIHPDGIVVTSLDIHFSTASSVPVDVDVYVTPGAYWNKDDIAGEWRKVSSGTIGTTSGRTVALDNVDVTDFYLPPGSYGLAFYSIGAGLAYTSTGNTEDYEHYALNMYAGRSRNALWGGTVYAPRLWDGCMHLAPLGTAGYGFYGQGCAGSAGIPSMSSSGAPQLGSSFSVDVNDTVANTPVFLVLGFDRTNSPLGPLPVDLTAVGLPGCDLHTRIDDWFLLFSNATGTATWNVTVPTSTNLLRVPFFNQALAIDGTVSPGIGAVTSDAWAGLIGL